MFRNQISRTARICIDKGQQVLAKLSADAKLVLATATMRAAQEALVARFAAFGQSLESLRTASAVHLDAGRSLRNSVREFALNLLSVTGNDHRDDTFLRYFPNGYGEALRGSFEEIFTFAGMLLDKLAVEADPWILTFRDRLVAAREAFVRAKEGLNTALVARGEAFESLQAEKRLWVAGVSRARLQTQSVYLQDSAYIRWLFGAVWAKPRKGTDELPPDSPPGAPSGVSTSEVHSVPDNVG